MIYFHFLETYARYPTLLHFGATFGLKKLVESILHGNWPGVVEAVLLKNCYQMKPLDLAKHYDQPQIQEQLLQFEVMHAGTFSLSLTVEKPKTVH